jgi:hypothetical protein
MLPFGIILQGTNHKAIEKNSFFKSCMQWGQEKNIIKVAVSWILINPCSNEALKRLHKLTSIMSTICSLKSFVVHLKDMLGTWMSCLAMTHFIHAQPTGLLTTALETGPSINTTCLKGPNRLNNELITLLRWRCYKIAPIVFRQLLK